MMRTSWLALLLLTEVASAQDVAPTHEQPFPAVAPALDAGEATLPAVQPVTSASSDAAPAVAVASPEVEPQPTASEGAPPAVQADAAAPQSKPNDKDKLDFRGRVRMGATFDSSTLRVGTVEVAQKQLTLALVEARLGAAYQALDWLSMNVEFDFAGKPQLKDAYVQLDSDGARGQFGQFKMPVSAMAQQSPWSLPMADRGVIQGILQDHIQMLGRRQGLIGRYRAPGKFRPELTVGIFQGLLGNSSDALLPAFALTETVDSQNEVASFGARLAGVDVGIVGERISSAVGARIRHFWSTGLDAQADYKFAGQGVRFWIEAFTGTSWKAEGGGASQPEIQFGTTRGILAWRMGGLHKGEAYVEPFVMAGVLDPELEVRGDMLWEAMAGVSGGVWRQLRMTLQFETAGSQYGFPDQVFVGNRVVARDAFLAQIGGGF